MKVIGPLLCAATLAALSTPALARDSAASETQTVKPKDRGCQTAQRDDSKEAPACGPQMWKRVEVGYLVPYYPWYIYQPRH